jgi:mediator of RNA polymerase II transcription subunit 10
MLRGGSGRVSRPFVVHSLTVVPPRAQNSQTLSQSLRKVYQTAASPTANLPQVPPELIQYVEDGRNPDIYTREFVELVRRGNQLMRGKQHAFQTFRDVLAEQINSAMPELREDVARVLAATSGDEPTAGEAAGLGAGADEANGGLAPAGAS